MDRSRRTIPVLFATGCLLVVEGCCPRPAQVPVGPAQCQCPQAQAAPPPAGPQATPAPAAQPAPAASARPAAVASATKPASTPAAQPAAVSNGPSTIVVKDVGLQTPECVLWDEEQDVYFVSNINGDATAVDGNGFISKLGPDGKVIELKFVDGGKKGSELNAPKGLAIAGNLLYVADLDTVRKFDRKTGKPKGKIPIKDAVFLNALTVAPNGKTLYVSDSAVKISGGKFTGTGADAIYAIDLKKHSVKPLIEDKALHWPNGVLADDSGIWVVSLGNNELIQVTYDGDFGTVTKLPKGSLDGIVKLKDGSFLISSWESSAVYRGLPGGEFKDVVTGVPSPAAIGFDGKRRALLIPIFSASAVEIHALPALPVLAAPTPPPAKPAAAPTAAPAAPAPVAPPAKAVAPAPAKPAAPAPTPAAPAPAASAPAASAPPPAAAPASGSTNPGAGRWP